MLIKNGIRHVTLCLFFISLIAFVNSCDYRDHRLRIVNATDTKIRFEVLRDSSYIGFVQNLLKFDEPNVSFRRYPLKNLEVCHENTVDSVRILIPWRLETYFKDGLWIYIFTDSLAQVTDSNDLNIRRVYTCMKYYSKKELKSTHWIVTIKDLKTEY